MSEINGRISQIIGPVIDVYFESEGKDSEKVLPKIYEALKIKRPDGSDLKSLKCAYAILDLSSK